MNLYLLALLYNGYLFINIINNIWIIIGHIFQYNYLYNFININMFIKCYIIINNGYIVFIGNFLFLLL